MPPKKSVASPVSTPRRATRNSTPARSASVASDVEEGTRSASPSPSPKASKAKAKSTPKKKPTTPKEKKVTTPKKEKKATAPKEKKATAPKEKKVTTPKTKKATAPKAKKTTTPKEKSSAPKRRSTRRASAKEEGEISEGDSDDVGYVSGIEDDEPSAASRWVETQAPVTPVKAQKGEWPLPLDVVWLGAFTKLAFAYAFLCVNPSVVFGLNIVKNNPQLANVLTILATPSSTSPHIAFRCALLFVIGSIPVRRWATRHAPEIRGINADTIIASVALIVKLALIQILLSSGNSVAWHAHAVSLHAGLGFAAQEFILGARSSVTAVNCHRLIELLGHLVIIVIPDSAVMTKSMFYTLTLLSISNALQNLLIIASSRRAYRSFSRAIVIGHTSVVLLGVPFIGKFLYDYSVIAAAAPAQFNPTVSSVLAPVACGSILLSSIILTHIDLLFK